MDSLKDDPFGAEVAEDLAASMEVSKHDDRQAEGLNLEQHHLRSLAEALAALLDRVTATERATADRLLHAFSYCSSDRYSNAVRALRAAALMAEPAQADLVRITISPNTLTVRSCLLHCWLCTCAPAHPLPLSADLILCAY